MAAFGTRLLLLPAALCVLVSATPAPSPNPEPNVIAPRDPLITPSPALSHPTRTYNQKRDIFDDLQSGVDSILSGLGTAIPSFVASGVPNFFQDFPTGDSVQSSLGIDDDQVAALPTQTLTVSSGDEKVHPSVATANV